jgi:signal transduction histidine kinase
LTLIAVRRDTTDQKRAEAQRRECQCQSSEARRLALEINDSIVQGLVLAQMTLALGCGREQGLEIVSRTLATARRLASDLLGERPVQPGDLVRSPAVGAASLDGPPA